MSRNKGDNVHLQNGVIFKGGDERKLLTEIDGAKILYEILQYRVDNNLRVGEASIEKEIKGVKLRFTQIQSRAKYINVEKVDE